MSALLASSASAAQNTKGGSGRKRVFCTSEGKTEPIMEILLLWSVNQVSRPPYTLTVRRFHRLTASCVYSAGLR